MSLTLLTLSCVPGATHISSLHLLVIGETVTRKIVQISVSKYHDSNFNPNTKSESLTRLHEISLYNYLQLYRTDILENTHPSPVYSSPLHSSG